MFAFPVEKRFRSVFNFSLHLRKRVEKRGAVSISHISYSRDVCAGVGSEKESKRSIARPNHGSVLNLQQT